MSTLASYAQLLSTYLTCVACIALRGVLVLGSEAFFLDWAGLVVVWSGSPLDDLVYRMAYPLVRVEFYPN